MSLRRTNLIVAGALAIAISSRTAKKPITSKIENEQNENDKEIYEIDTEFTIRSIKGENTHAFQKVSLERRVSE